MKLLLESESVRQVQVKPANPDGQERGLQCI